MFYGMSLSIILARSIDHFQSTSIFWRCGIVVIPTAQLRSTKPELRFWAGSNPACGVSETWDGEDL